MTAWKESMTAWKESVFGRSRQCLITVWVISVYTLAIITFTTLSGWLRIDPAPTWTALASGEYDDALLTIAIDADRGSCPDNCAFIHPLLPDWVRWRYISFRDDNIGPINSAALIVTRWIHADSPVLRWARHHPHPVGLLLMADETNQQDSAVYSAFDYVLRNYYFERLYKAQPDLNLYALGNLTCGTGAAWPPQDGTAPLLGVHWLPLQGRGLGNLDSHHAPESHWPSSRRSKLAVFIGSLRADRTAMLEVIRSLIPEEKADLQLEEKFGGSVTPYYYGYERLARSVFALVPYGNSPETHRLSESIGQGAIPVMLEAAFTKATFEQVPGIIRQDWVSAGHEINELLNGDPGRLDQLQDKVVRWYQRLQDCIRSDLDKILRHAIDMKRNGQ